MYLINNYCFLLQREDAFALSALRFPQLKFQGLESIQKIYNLPSERADVASSVKKLAKKHLCMPLQNNYRGQSNYHNGYHSSGGNRRPYKSHRGQHHLPNQQNTQNANQEVAKE